MPKEKRGRDKAGLKDSEEKRARKAQALGAWNPKVLNPAHARRYFALTYAYWALIVKGAQQEENCSLVLFYQYVEGVREGRIRRLVHAMFDADFACAAARSWAISTSTFSKQVKYPTCLHKHPGVAVLTLNE
eukprot:134294-Rhodomonas_salina.2